MGEIGDILPGTEIGSSENVVDCSFDLGKRRLATISSQGTIRIFERPERQDVWIEDSTWDLPGKPSLCRVTIFMHFLACFFLKNSKSE